MAHSQNLLTNIIINAKTGSGFSEVGSVLTEMGSIVNGISQELISFGKDSVEVYRDYEKSMTEAEIALSTTYGRGTRELNTVMQNLDKYASQWAASTIFHTDDVGNAISNAAHAGWDYDQIMSGIPAAMELAQAGSLDLSAAVDYITKATHSAGIGFEDLGGFIDHWSYAANRSATDIEGMGEAMLRMGATMKFAGGQDELFVMLAELANAGTVGSDAGTLLRNSMLRLIAPTKKASDVMAELGVEGEEIEEILNDEAVAAANAALAARGFSAYDDQGNLKSMLDIFTDLNAALDGMHDDERYKIMSSIFPVRSITGAMALLNGAKEGWHGLFDELKNGAADDYGSYAMGKMLETLDGQIKMFDSKLEELKRKTGESLAGDVGNALGSLGGFVDNLSTMDSGTFSALISGLEVIATAGPGLIAAGTALRFIGRVLGPAGAIGMGVIGLTSLLSFFRELDENRFQNLFGTGDYNHETLSAALNEIQSDFQKTYADVKTFQDGVDAAFQQYQNVSAEFSENLFTDMATKKKLTPDEVEQYFRLGEQMQEAVLLGVQGNADAAAQFLTSLYGEDAKDSDAYKSLVSTLTSGTEDAIADVNAKSQELRDALTSAFQDRTITPEERENIQALVQDLNDAITEAQEEAAAQAKEISDQAFLNKLQSMSYDAMNEMADEAAAQRDQIESEEFEYYNESLAALQVAHKHNTANASPQEQEAADREFAAATADMESRYNADLAARLAPIDETIIRGWMAGMSDSDIGTAFNELQHIVEQINTGKVDNVEAVYEGWVGRYGTNRYAAEQELAWEDKTREDLTVALTDLIDKFGGAEGIEARATQYEENGQPYAAQMLRDIQTMQEFNAGGKDISKIDMPGFISWLTGDSLYNNSITGGLEGLGATTNHTISTLDDARTAVENYRQTVGDSGIAAFVESFIWALGSDRVEDIQAMETAFSEMSDGARMEISSIGESLSQQFDLEKLKADMGLATTGWLSDYESSGMIDAAAIMQLLFGGINPEDYENEIAAHKMSRLSRESEEPIEVPAIPVISEEAALSIDPIIVDVQPNMAEEDVAASVGDEAVVVDVTGETGQLSEAISAEDMQTLTEMVDGDTGDLHVKIWDEDSQTLTEYAIGDVSQLAAAIDSQNGRHIQVIVDQVQGATVSSGGGGEYALGGRATTASIFGEAGPEWAIPEEHTQRTAELLNAAREASGFTWPELLSQFGGLNANPNNMPATIVYSPVINSSNPGEIEQILKDDKERLRRMLREERMLNSMEVYA